MSGATTFTDEVIRLNARIAELEAQRAELLDALKGMLAFYNETIPDGAVYTHEEQGGRVLAAEAAIRRAEGGKQ